MSILKPFNLAEYLAETDKQFARIQANINAGQQIIDEVYQFCDEDPAQRRFEGRTEQKPEEKKVA